MPFYTYSSSITEYIICRWFSSYSIKSICFINLIYITSRKTSYSTICYSLCYNTFSNCSMYILMNKFSTVRLIWHIIINICPIQCSGSYIIPTCYLKKSIKKISCYCSIIRSTIRKWRNCCSIWCPKQIRSNCISKFIRIWISCSLNRNISRFYCSTFNSGIVIVSKYSYFSAGSTRTCRNI